MEGTYSRNFPLGSTVTQGPSACPHPAKLPVCTKLYGPVREDATACSMVFFPSVSALEKIWY